LKLTGCNFAKFFGTNLVDSFKPSDCRLMGKEVIVKSSSNFYSG